MNSTSEWQVFGGYFLFKTTAGMVVASTTIVTRSGTSALMTVLSFVNYNSQQGRWIATTAIKTAIPKVPQIHYNNRFYPFVPKQRMTYAHSDWLFATN